MTAGQFCAAVSDCAICSSQRNLIKFSESHRGFAYRPADHFSPFSLILRTDIWTNSLAYFHITAQLRSFPLF
ncbi:hypothetical protein CLOSTMETH_03840 [[Clostridium] methylpentosum DSM 5476]|uniref:Uncharacterized protein n=1 Tax=[Clostridium] methylpentosum DSM 5476 TaxID=537013 RepID=C0EIZ4_9FIRM|nr:hypothetical protein CLOSTMETH_03840 [[Clostridium] methylpentosum DSM 5476]